jgi:hypothetical protein
MENCLPSTPRYSTVSLSTQQISTRRCDVMHMFAEMLYPQPSTMVELDPLLTSNLRVRREQDGTGLRFEIVVLHNDKHLLLVPCDQISFHVSSDIYKPFSTFLTSFHCYAMALSVVSTWEKYIYEEPKIGVPYTSNKECTRRKFPASKKRYSSFVTRSCASVTIRPRHRVHVEIP